MKTRYAIAAGLLSFFISIACGFHVEVETKKASAQDTSQSAPACTFDNVREGSSFFCTGANAIYPECFICQYQGTQKYECRRFDATRCR